MPRIIFETEGGYQISCPQQAVIALGRRDDANHQQIDIDFAELGEQGVSRLHAFIHINADGITIEDFNSRNGTFLNHYQIIPLRHYPIQDRDHLKLGRIQLLIRITD